MNKGQTNQELLIEKEPYGFAKPWHRQFPPMLVVSITNVCNLRCTHCYYSKFIKLPEYKPSMFPWNLWEKICEETGAWPGVILNFGTDGEPLCHPRLIQMLELARKYRIYPINITTNGVLMDEKFIKPVLDHNLVDIINISLDAITPETYKKIRGGDFAHVMKNVHDLIEKRNRTKSHLKIQVNIIDQPDSRGELEEFKAYWENHVDNIMIRTYYDATSVTGHTGPNITGKQRELEKVERWPCQQLWRRFNISDNGIVRFCVDDWFNKTNIGDINEQTIAEIWTGEAYNNLRHKHIRGKFGNIPYCAPCTEWQGMKWNYDYFYAIKNLLGKDFV